ncbi:MAG: universal stress protein, partial [Chloroflexota bacterium]|nr:universal stress protein [Chloroflexota bacterium]
MADKRKRILVPLDGSPLAEQIISYVGELARGLEAEVVLLHICGPGEHQYRHMHGIYLEGVASLLRRQLDGNRKTQTVLLQGEDVPEEILRYSAAHQISFIALSTRGRSGLGRSVLGSVSGMVLEASEVPVLLVKSSEEAKPPQELGKSFLVPLDGSRLGEAALATVEDLAPKLGREVCLLQVVPPAQGVVRVERHVVYPEQQLASQKAFAQDYLQGVENKLVTRGIKARSQVKIGLPADIIVDYATESNAGFI